MMKEKLKVFVHEKKDLLIFLGVLVLTFVSVITIASIAKNKNNEPVGGEIVPTTPTPTITPTTPTPTKPADAISFVLPIKDEYVVSRLFFDVSLTDEELAKAVMTNGTTFVESKGMSYKKEDNSLFDVLCVYPGTVLEVSGEEDSLTGYTVKVKHIDDIVSIYSALSSVSVSVGDSVEAGMKLGVGGTSINDLESGVHVHLEIMCGANYLNPKDIIGKEVSEVVSSVK